MTQKYWKEIYIKWVKRFVAIDIVSRLPAYRPTNLNLFNDFLDDGLNPVYILRQSSALVFFILFPNIIGRRCNNEIDRFIFQTVEQLESVPMEYAVI